MNRLTIAAIAVVACVAACGKGGDSKPTDDKPVAETPVTCPPGSVASGKDCVKVVTPEAPVAVEAEKSRIEELAGVLDKVDALSAPIELLDGMRQQDSWKKLAAGNDKLQIADQIIGTLNDAVKEIRAIKDSLGGAAAKLGDIKGQLDGLLKDTTGRTLADVRAQISGEVKAAMEPVATELANAAEKVLVPVTEQVKDGADLIIGACAVAKMSGGGDQLKALCDKAKDVLPKAVAYLEDAKTKPAALLSDVTGKLTATLDQLIDTETKAALDAAQAKVNTALKLQPAAGSATGSGSGS